MENLITFLNESIVLLVLIMCLCIGFIIKNIIPNDKINRFIPLIVAVLGVFINVWYNGFDFTPETVLGGLVSGLASTGLHQVFKQFLETDICQAFKQLLDKGGK